MQDHHTPTTPTDTATYTIPLEVSFNDIRECRIDHTTTASDILAALLGDIKTRPVANWALLETVYERGVLNNQLPTGKQTEKRPQMVIKQLRLLEPSQPMHELVKDILPELSSPQRSVISVINARNETVVFLNPYFRMLTGLPISHISMFPEEDTTVKQFNQQVRVKLGLSADDDRFALFGYYGRHVARLEEKCKVDDLRATWEGEATKKQERRIGFFQFQAVPEKADQELLGIERASWLYVKRESGFWQSNRKLYCVLKGTTLFLYKSNKSREKVGEIKNVDSCRVFNLGSNLLRTSHQFQLVEPVTPDKQPRPTTHLFSSPYGSRIKKWLRVLARCRRTFESQIPVTYEDPDGEVWWSCGRLNNDCKVPFNKRRFRERYMIDPNQVPTVQMTCEQRFKFDTVEKLYQSALVAGHQYSEETRSDWLEKVRLFAMEVTALQRPGFGEKVIQLCKRLINSVNQQQLDKTAECLTNICNLYKQHILDLASFPASPTRDFGQELADIRAVFETKEYHTKYYEELDVVEQIELEGVDLEAEPLVEPVESEQPMALDGQHTIGGQSNEISQHEGSILKRMKKLLISSRPSVAASQSSYQQKQQVIIEIDPTSPARTDISGCISDYPEGTVNEPIISDLPPRSLHSKPIDARSTTSSKSSFGRRAKAIWNRVTSPLSAHRDEKLSPTMGGRSFTTTSQGFPLPAPMMMPNSLLPTPELMAQFAEFQQFRQFQMLQMQQQSQSKTAAWIGDNNMRTVVAPTVAPNGPFN